MSALPATPHHDVIVVGARCAGAATAMLLAERGLDVLVVDRAVLPSDTISTHSIARGGIVQLQRWDLLDDVLASGAPPIREVVFHAHGTSTRRTVKERAGVDHLLAPRRHVLDAILARAAVAAGATLRTGLHVDGLRRDDDGRVTGIFGQHDGTAVEQRARLVVGADGVRSRVTRSVDAAVTLAGPPTGATHYAYYHGLDWDAVEYFLGDRTFSGIFPTHDDQACVWVCLPAEDAAAVRAAGDPATTFERLVAHASADLRARISGARRTSPARSATGLPNQARRPFGDGWVLVGDAGYHRDPITGHGITDAFRDAELAADAIHAALDGTDETSALRAYEAERDRLARPIFDLTCQLGRFPDQTTFVELQRQLSQAIDLEATTLAARARPVAIAA